jgi:hypothetical protein
VLPNNNNLPVIALISPFKGVSSNPEGRIRDLKGKNLQSSLLFSVKIYRPGPLFSHGFYEAYTMVVFLLYVFCNGAVPGDGHSVWA